MRLLLLTAALAFAVSAQAQPRPNATPQTTLAVAEAGASATVQAGGADRMSIPGSGCSGYIDDGRPGAAVTVTGSGSLAIWAVSAADATMLVQDPAGRWHCSDDANGSNPAVTFASAAPGRYVVWVGTFSPNSPSPATLSAGRGQPAW